MSGSGPKIHQTFFRYILSFFFVINSHIGLNQYNYQYSTGSIIDRSKDIIINYYVVLINKHGKFYFILEFNKKNNNCLRQRSTIVDCIDLSLVRGLLAAWAKSAVATSYAQFAPFHGIGPHWTQLFAMANLNCIVKFAVKAAHCAPWFKTPNTSPCPSKQRDTLAGRYLKVPLWW